MASNTIVQNFLGPTDSVQNATNNSSGEDYMNQNKFADAFWTHATIDGSRWDKNFPYELRLVKRDKSGKYLVDNIAKKFIYALPFSPDSYQISMPFAVNGSVTQQGYVEEDNGAPIRMISFSGTTGVLPLRGTPDTRPEPNLAQAIFAGTIKTAGNVASSARNFNSDNINGNFKKNLVSEDLFGLDANKSVIDTSSGYSQFRLLQQFLENYVAFKKTSVGRDYRLAFCTWKDDAVYLVTPQQFVVARVAGAPFEYPYSMQLKAWRRINISNISSDSTNQFKPTVLKANALNNLLNSITAARSVLENARDIAAAVGGDLDHALFEPLRQIALFAKDALSVPLSFADLPLQIIQSAKSAIIGFISVVEGVGGASQTFKNQSQAVADAYQAIAQLGAQSSKSTTGDGELVNANLVAGGNFNTSFDPSVDIDPATDPFRNPSAYYDFFSQINVGQVNLPPTIIRAIAAERQRVRSLQRLDFEQMRDQIIQYQADFADAVGAGSASYNAAFNRATSVISSKVPTPSDFQVMFALNRAGIEFNRLAVSGDTNRGTITTNDYVAGLASQSSIAFTVPQGKFAIPMPYGHTLEQVATIYLGDPDRWIEIATLNGLRAPYIDEVGFSLPLLVKGRGNQVTVATNQNLFLGQQIQIGSNASARVTCRITALQNLPSGVTTVTVDGDGGLERFSTLSQAYIHAFLPATVNSQMMLYIPSDIAPDEQLYDMKAVPELDEFDQLLAAGGFDILLTQSNDLAITPDGDCRLAVGLANIIQTARLRLSVVQGTLPRHPTYGLPAYVGIATGDVDAKTLLKAARGLFDDDPAFTGVTSASVNKNGPVLAIMLGVTVRGQSNVIPIALNFAN